MKKQLELKNEEYFTYCNNDNNFVSSGEITGTFTLYEKVECDNFKEVFCIESQETFLIKK